MQEYNWRGIFLNPKYVDSKSVEFKINADFVYKNVQEECYREVLVSYLPMLPLLEKTVPLEDADYIIYMHPYARCDDLYREVLDQLYDINNRRKKDAQIIVVGKAANIEPILNGSITNITFILSHFTEKLGEKFGLDIKESYFVYDNETQHLAIWPVDGCKQKCKFCRRSFMYIPFESLSLDTIKQNLDIIKENKPEFLKYISLRAENLTEYGIDIYGKPSLPKLIELLDSYDEIEVVDIAIGVCISEVTPEILDSLCNFKKLRSIAMNPEAGSNRLLKLIGKKHTMESAAYVFERLRKAHPDLYIQSLAMLGLPTETDDDVIGLADFIVRVKPNYLKINYYLSSDRHPLASLPKLDEDTKEEHLIAFVERLNSTLKSKLELVCPGPFKKMAPEDAERIRKELELANANSGFRREYKICLNLPCDL